MMLCRVLPAVLALPVTLLLATGSEAAEMRSVQVEYEDGVYYLESEVWFEVARKPVFDVFADWDIAVEFSSFIVESRDIGPDEDGAIGYYVHNRGCILFFCKNAVRSGAVSAEPHTLLQAVADPEVSDFEISEESWTFTEDGEGTLVRYELKVKPDFWIPPVIGPYLMKKKLRNDSSDAIQRIERIAQERAANGE